MKHFRMFSLIAMSALLSSFAVAQTPGANTDTNTETAPVQQVTTPPAQPIVVNWKFKKGAGNANLTINADGTYLFSGSYNDKKPNKDFDIAMALKSSTGGIVLFHFAGDASNGVQWSKQGDNVILKDDFQTFAKHSWNGEYHFSLTAEGRAKLYEEQEKKKEELKKEEEEAKKRHDEKVAAEKKKEREEEEQKEQQQAQQAAQQKSSGGGGSSVWSTVGDVAGAIGGALLALF